MSWFTFLFGNREKIERDGVLTDSLEERIKKISTKNEIISVEKDSKPLNYIWKSMGLEHSDFSCGECGSKDIKITKAEIKYRTPMDKIRITDVVYGCFCGSCGRESDRIEDIAPKFELPERGKNIAGGDPYSYF